MTEYDPQHDYDSCKLTKFTKSELEGFIGFKGVLPLTGRFVEVRESDSGPFMMFQPDERWGLAPGYRLGFDMEAFKGVEDV